MKYINFIFIALITLSLSANAEVFKCKNATGKIIYQSEPCSSDEITQGVIKVKQMTPEETETAKAKLKAWQEEQAVEEAEKREVERQRQAEMERQESLALQRRSVIAQERQAIAEQQRPYLGGGGVFIPSYGFNGRNFGNQMFPPFGTLNPNILPQQPNNSWNQNMMPSQPPGQSPLPMPSFSPHPAAPGIIKHH
jgi:hypothetical protein